MYALIRTGGKQYRVTENAVVAVDKLPLNVGGAFETDQVLLVADGNGTRIGMPVIAGARVKGTVLAQNRQRRVSGLKFKPKKRYLKRYGHRQPYSLVRIEKIEA